jgi:biopolymer transport protein ExbD
LPKAEPFRAEDQAEALEPVESGFRWRRPHDEEEEDVDMIPLIDVSLVLLVFFIMTTTGAFFINITTPATIYSTTTTNPELLWIGIDWKNENTIYSIGFGERADPTPEDQKPTAREQIVKRLDEILAELESKGKTPVEVQIKAHEQLPAGHVTRMRVELGKPQRRDKISRVWAGVRDKVY